MRAPAPFRSTPVWIAIGVEARVSRSGERHEDEPSEERRTRFSTSQNEFVERVKRRPRLAIAATLVTFGALTLVGRSLSRFVRGRRAPRPEGPTERAPETRPGVVDEARD